QAGGPLTVPFSQVARATRVFVVVAGKPPRSNREVPRAKKYEPGPQTVEGVRHGPRHQLLLKIVIEAQQEVVEIEHIGDPDVESDARSDRRGLQGERVGKQRPREKGPERSIATGLK